MASRLPGKQQKRKRRCWQTFRTIRPGRQYPCRDAPAGRLYKKYVEVIQMNQQHFGQSQKQAVVLLKQKLLKYPVKFAKHAIRLRDWEFYFQRSFVRYHLRPLSETIFWSDRPETLQPDRIEINDATLTALRPDEQQILLWEKSS
jgi:hypothetical protein